MSTKQSSSTKQPADPQPPKPNTRRSTGAGRRDDDEHAGTGGVSLDGINIVLLQGALSSDTRQRVLPSGAVLVSWEVTTRSDGAPAQSVPVVAFDPPKSSVALTSGTEVLVVGRIRRRFFRAGGATVSRTEVEALRICALRRGAQARRAMEVFDTTVAAFAERTEVLDG